MGQVPILDLRDVRVLFGGRRRWFSRSQPAIRAVRGVSLSVFEGEIVGLIGESGCGKTTLGRTILGLQREAGGEIRLDGRVVSGLPPAEARAARRDIHYVYQDAAAALDPWWSIGGTLEETLQIHGERSARERDARVDAVLNAVGLNSSIRRRYPHELSGGQLRRIALARVLVLKPRIVILDEPTSGLDMSVQAMALKLLLDLRQQLRLTYLFISHDLSVVERLCDRVGIMYLGRIVELAPTREIFARPRHPYTQALLAAAPRLSGARERRAVALPGEPPSAAHLPRGCAFAPRCPYAEAACRAEEPILERVTEGHVVACIRWRDIAGAEAEPGMHADALCPVWGGRNQLGEVRE